MQVECRYRIGHLIWHRDFCEGHAAPIIAKSKALGIDVFWWQEADGHVTACFPRDGHVELHYSEATQRLNRNHESPAVRDGGNQR